jgi:hypothetical protein
MTEFRASMSRSSMNATPVAKGSAAEELRRPMWLTLQANIAICCQTMLLDLGSPLRKVRRSLAVTQ